MTAASHVAALARFCNMPRHARVRATTEMHDCLRKNKLEQIAERVGRS